MDILFFGWLMNYKSVLCIVTQATKQAIIVNTAHSHPNIGSKMNHPSKNPD